ncbi:MAG: glutamate racemase [Firmicutes bacterium]|nr:glutamate racemase [Bacillota bacterium]
MDLRPIGVYDSGVGGLTVVREISRGLPKERVIYFGDTARVPYGDRTTGELRRFSQEIITFLKNQGSKFIIAACNTTSSQVLDDIKMRFEVPVIGVLRPGAYAASKATRVGRIGVIATIGTTRSNAYEKAIREHLPEGQVFGMACPRLVPLIEEGNLDSEETIHVLRSYLNPLVKKGIDVLILGCTHYPYLVKHIKTIVGPGVGIIDPAEETIKEVAVILKKLGLESTEKTGPYEFFVSGEPSRFMAVGEKLPGNEQIKAKQVNLSDLSFPFRIIRGGDDKLGTGVKKYDTV